MPKLYKVLRWLNILTLLILIGSALVLLLIPVMWLVLAVFVVGLLISRSKRVQGILGTARWAEPRDIPHLMKDEGGLPIGVMGGSVGKTEAAKGLLNPRRTDEEAVHAWLSSFERHRPGRQVYLNTAVHTIVCASTGAGKSASMAVRFLLSNRGSAVILDVKAELCQNTIATRRKYGQVAILDPFNLAGGKDSINALDIDPESPYALDDCRDLADALIEKTEGSKDPYWENAATDMLAAFIGLCVAQGKGADKSMQAVRGIMSNADYFKRGVVEMKDSRAFNGMLSRWGHQIAAIHPKQLASVVSMVHKSLNFLDTPSVAAITGHVSTFAPSMLRKGVLSIFLVLPPERLKAQAGLVRMWLTVLARAALREGLDKATPVTFLIDEAASIGSLPVIPTILQIGRAYQIHLQMYYQSLGQIMTAWPNGGEKLLLGNMVQVHAGTNDYSDAEAISKQIGNWTAVLESGGTGTSHSTTNSGQGASSSASYSTNDNWNLNSTPLLRPEQILTLPPRMAITFMPNTRPILTRLVPWWAQNTDAKSRAWCVAHSVALFLCSVGLLLLSTLIVKESAWQKRNPIPNRSPSHPTKASSKSSEPKSTKLQERSTKAR